MNEFRIKNGFFSEGSSNITGSLEVTGGITGSLQGIATSASFASTASFLIGGVTIDTGSLVTTSSFENYTGSAASQFAGTASFASTASFITGSGVIGTVASSSYALSSSYATFAETASSATNAQDILVYVLNNSGYTISKGAVVHITASGNASDIPRIVTASYENDNNSANTLGLAYQTLTNGSFGYVLTEGILRGIDTSNFQSGQLIYLGATGSIIGSAPQAPLHGVRLGQVVREQTNNGSIYVSINNGYELDELHDVRIVTASLQYGDLLMRSGSVWTNTNQLSGSYGLTGSLVIKENATDEIINSVTRTLKSTGGTSSIDWENKHLISGNVVAIDWNNSEIYNGPELSINWNTRNLVDSQSTDSVNWNERTLVDSGNTITLNWNSQRLFGNALSIDWLVRILYDVNEATSVDWENRALKDTNNANSINWENRKLYDPFESEVLIWDYPTPQFYGTASLARTASFVTPLNQNVTVIGNQTITGSFLVTDNLTVLGSASIQYISESVLNIGTNLITVNTFSPSTRFGGMAVIDSGSSPLVSASFLYDSVQDEFIFVHKGDASGAITSSHFLLGPETYNDLGNETYLTANRIPKGTGIEHLNDSNITDTGTVVSINSNSEITGSLTLTGSLNITGSVVSPDGNNVTSNALVQATLLYLSNNF